MPAAHAAAQVTTLKFDRLTSENGLSDNYVTCAIQDSHGFMWFGTRDGLNRFDGYSFLVYRHDPTVRGSLSDGSIESLLEDRRRRLWVGTHSGGLDRFDAESERFRHYRHDQADPCSIGEGRITSLCEDARGNLWAGTTDRASGVSRWEIDEDAFTRFRYDPLDPNSLSSDRVAGVCRDSAGNVWVATMDSGLNRYDPSICGFINHHTVPAYACVADEPLNAIRTDRDGRLLLFTGLNTIRFDPRTACGQRFAPAGEGAPVVDPLATVLTDRGGTCWTASHKRGVIASNPTWEGALRLRNSPAVPTSIASDVVFCICEDNAGNIWFGTERGISRVNRRTWQFRYLQHDPFDSTTIAGPVVRSMAVDRSDALWLGTNGGGLDRWDRGAARVRHMRLDNDTIDGGINTVNTIHIDAAGNKWLGTNWGLVLIRADGTRSFWHHNSKDSNSIGHGGVWSILERRSGEIWVGTLYSGINILDRNTGRFRHLRHDPLNPAGLSSNGILALFETPDGAVWAGTDNGLNRIDPRTGRCRHYQNDVDDSTSLSNNRVWFIIQATDGMLWIATSGGGVNRMDPATGRCRRFSERDGLAANTAAALMEDGHGNIWASTARGLSRINPTNGTVRSYLSSDGLPVYEYHFKSCCRDSSGTIYFGGTNGAVGFRPDDLVDNSHAPPVEITSFRTIDSAFHMSTSLASARTITLGPENNSFTLEFAALDYTNPQANRYRYVLEGFDREPRAVTASHRFAEYTNVPPGHYRFIVSGANSDNLWSVHSRSVEIVVEPAYWQTWWFRGIAIIAGAAVIGGALVARVRSVRNKEQTERRVVEYQLQALRAQMNPHFLFNSLNSILYFVVRRDIESAQSYLSAFSSLVRNTLESVRSDSVSLADELESLRLYLKLESLRFKDRFNVSIEIASEIDPDAVDVPPMIIQPYVENALRHGLAHKEGHGSIAIHLRRRADDLLCSIVDDGVGRQRSAEIQRNELRAHRVHGMALTRNRLDVLSRLHRQRYHVAVTDLVSDGGSALGTRVDISIPIGPAAKPATSSTTTSA